MFTSQESHAMLLPHEAAFDKTGKVPSPDFKTVWLNIETDAIEQ